MPLRGSPLRILAAVAVPGLLAACAPRDIGHPVDRKLNWFAFLNGDDLRPACAAGEEAYRFVYNADYTRQVRIYDVAVRPDGRAELTVRVIGPATLAEVTLERGDLDLMAPWRGTVATATLGPADVARLRRAVTGPDGAPPGLEVTSDATYWVTGGCPAGDYRFNLLAYPSDRFDAFRLDELLFARDHSGVPVAPPRKPGRNLPGAARDADPVHRLRVGDNGLWGLRGGF